MAESIEYIRQLEWETNNVQSLSMLGLKGLKFRGIELDNYGPGFNPKNIEKGDALELLILQIKRYILNLSYLIVSCWIFFYNKLHPLAIYNLIQFAKTEQDLIKLSQNGVPETILITIDLKRCIKPLPPMIPEPYLSFDKKLVVPTQKEINNALDLNLQYANSMALFKQNEILTKMMCISKCIKYCTLMGINFLQLLVSNEDLMNDEEKLVEFIKLELLSSSSSYDHTDKKRMKLIFHNSTSMQKNFIINTGNGEIGEIDCEVILAPSIRNSNTTTIINTPDLIMSIDKDLKKLQNHKLLQLPIMPMGKEVVFYGDNYKDFSIASFYQAIEHWQTNQSISI